MKSYTAANPIIRHSPLVTRHSSFLSWGAAQVAQPEPIGLNYGAAIALAVRRLAAFDFAHDLECAICPEEACRAREKKRGPNGPRCSIFTHKPGPRQEESLARA